MIKLRQAVIVEGKYDKITLGNIIDATIIVTDGFGIFKDKGKCQYIKRLAQTNGIIIMTDSDAAGFMIRSYIKNICGNTDNIVNVYIPQLLGKEKRKDVFSKEGYLGVEGMSTDVIIECLKKSGITQSEFKEVTKKVSKGDLYSLGLSGGQNSAFLRKELCEFLDLPINLSSSAFLDAVNAIYGYDEFIEAVKKWQRETGKN